MGTVKLYRRRYIPDEIVYLKDDIILKKDDDIIVTKWNVLKPRTDFTHGVSCYYIKEGFKISRFIDSKDKPLYWYCDIIDTEIKNDTYIFNDLLIDIKVYDNGFVKVMDLDEVGRSIRNNVPEREMLALAAERADRLLNIIYEGRFDEYTKYINEVL